MDPDEQAPRSGTPQQRGRHATRIRRILGGTGPGRWRLLTLAVAVLAGSLFVTSAQVAGGLDLRASSVTDLDTVVRQERDRVDALQQRIADLDTEVTELGQSVDDAQVTALQRRVAALEGPAGFTEVHGPAVTVTLQDAPKEDIDAAVESGAVTAEQLVVHQQDIQAVVNALWLGGAEAMTLQGQRVISTTGIKCVGNTVILHGVPYAPPYVITAIGSHTKLLDALEDSEYIDGYKTYVQAHNLGYSVRVRDDVTMPGFEGGAELRHASALPPDAATGPDRAAPVTR